MCVGISGSPSFGIQQPTGAGSGSNGHISGMADIRGVPHEVFSELISINELEVGIAAWCLSMY